jgi:hypothetical protein
MKMTAPTTTIRENLNTRPTEQDKGLILDLEILAYDNGMITVNGRPVSSDPSNPTTAWMEVFKVIAISLSEFQRKFSKRRVDGLGETIKAKPGTKAKMVGELLQRPKGLSNKEARKATGYQTISIAQQAKMCGLQVTKRKVGKETRYFA